MNASALAIDKRAHRFRMWEGPQRPDSAAEQNRGAEAAPTFTQSR